MQNGVDMECSGRALGKAYAVVADAEAQHFGVALQLLDVAFAGASEAQVPRSGP